MEKRRVINHYAAQNQFEAIDRILNKICFHAAPTMQHMKPSTLITF